MATMKVTYFVFETGFFNPQTTCYDTVVDCFRVITYNNAVGVLQVVHALMAPLRAFTIWSNAEVLLHMVSKTMHYLIMR